MQTSVTTTSIQSSTVAPVQEHHQPIVPSDFSKGEKNALKNLEKEEKRVEKSIKSDEKKLAKAAKRLEKDEHNGKTGKRIQKDQAVVKEAERELNYDLAKREQLEAKIHVLSVSDQYVAPNNHSGGLINDPLARENISAVNANAGPAVVQKNTSITTTTTTNGSGHNNVIGQNSSLNNPNVSVIEHVHPTKVEQHVVSQEGVVIKQQRVEREIIPEEKLEVHKHVHPVEKALIHEIHKRPEVEVVKEHVHQTHVKEVHEHSYPVTNVAVEKQIVHPERTSVVERELHQGEVERKVVDSGFKS